MALVRCERCGARGITRTYVLSVAPPNHPDSGLVCGRSTCSVCGRASLRCLREVPKTTQRARRPKPTLLPTSDALDGVRGKRLHGYGCMYAW